MHTPLEELKHRYTELDNVLATYFGIFLSTQKKLLTHESDEYYREVEWRRVQKFRLKEPVNYLFVKLISALKSIDDLSPACEAFRKDLNVFLEEDGLSAGDRDELTQMYITIQEVRENFEKGIKVYTAYYLHSNEDFKRQMHEVFESYPEESEWFASYLRVKDFGIKAFFEASGNNMGVEIDPKELYKNAQQRLDRLMNEFDKWRDVIEEFNNDYNKKFDTYENEVERYAKHCKRFAKMKVFISELRNVSHSFEDYSNTLPPSKEKKALDKHISAVWGMVEKLETNVFYLYRAMQRLAKEYSEKQGHLMSSLLCKFMQTWLNPDFENADKLEESVHILRSEKSKVALSK